MIGAVAAGLTAAASKSTNPNMTLILTAVGMGLAFYANSPRNIESRDRSTDEHDEHDIARMSDEHG